MDGVEFDCQLEEHSPHAVDGIAAGHVGLVGRQEAADKQQLGGRENDRHQGALSRHELAGSFESADVEIPRCSLRLWDNSVSEAISVWNTY